MSCKRLPAAAVMVAVMAAIGPAATAVAAAAPPQVMLHVPILAAACTGGCQIDAAEQFAPGVLAMPLHSYEHAPGAQALAVSADGGAVFAGASARGTGSSTYDPAHRSWSAANAIWGGRDSMELLAAGPNVRYDNGLLVLQPGNQSWASTFRMRYEWDASVHALRVTNQSTPVTFVGLPKPARAPAADGNILPTGFLPPTWIRFNGGSIVHLGNSTWLRTAMVCFEDNPRAPASTSIVAFISRDSGSRWVYMATVVDAAAVAAESMEGPNEHDIVRLPGGRLVIAMRFDGGDGHDACIANCTAAGWKPYFWSTSDDEGRSWSAPVPMVGTGSARPRLLLLGSSTLLLSGGRMRYKTVDGVGPSTDNNLWVADATVVATGAAPPVWRPYAISYWHNLLYDGKDGAPGRYTSRVNSSATNKPETRSYGALLPACANGSGISCSEAVLLYGIGSKDFANGDATPETNNTDAPGQPPPHCGANSSTMGMMGRYCTYVFAMRISVAPQPFAPVQSP